MSRDGFLGTTTGANGHGQSRGCNGGGQAADRAWLGRQARRCPELRRACERSRSGRQAISGGLRPFAHPRTARPFSLRPAGSRWSPVLSRQHTRAGRKGATVQRRGGTEPIVGVADGGGQQFSGDWACVCDARDLGVAAGKWEGQVHGGTGMPSFARRGTARHRERVGRSLARHF